VGCGVVVTLQTRILRAISSNSGRNTGYLERIFVSFVCLYRPIVVMFLADVMRRDPIKFFPIHSAYRSLLICLLTPNIVLWLGKIPYIYGTRRFIIVFTAARYYSVLSQINSIHVLAHPST